MPEDPPTHWIKWILSIGCFLVPQKKCWSHPSSWNMKNHQQTPTAEQRQVSNTAIAILRLVRTHLNRYADVSVSCPQRLPVSKGAGRSSKIIKVQTGWQVLQGKMYICICIYLHSSHLGQVQSVVWAKPSHVSQRAFNNHESWWKWSLWI